MATGVAPPKAKLDLLVAILTLIGSLASCIGAGFITLTYIFLPPKKRHFRHALIINLAVADLINATNNSVSGLYILISGNQLVPGAACTANGFIGQLSVQAVDTTIFLITLTLFYVLTCARTLPNSPPIQTTALLVAVPWILPIITSTIALGKDYYRPVTGNWCWIKADPTYLRYVLTHGWRFLSIAAIIAMGLYVHLYLLRHIHMLKSDLSGFSEHSSSSRKRSTAPHHEDEETKFPYPVTAAYDLGPRTESETRLTHHHHHQPSPMRNSSMPANSSSAIQKVLLLNAYPLLYILLWMPGIANRIAEASGHPTRVLRIMQASTQFVGFANAVTFGWNEGVGRRVIRRMRGEQDV